jgi:type II secretory pathway pseudopilin PulG
MPRKKENKKGLTLMETLIAIGIFAMVAQLVGWLFIKNLHTNATILTIGKKSIVAGRSLDKITKNLRKMQTPLTGEAPFVSGGDFSLTFFSDVDNDGQAEKVRYFLAGQNFQEGIAEVTGNPPTYSFSTKNIKNLTNNIVNAADEPIFFYYARNSAGELTSDALSLPEEMAKVTSVRINLKVRTNENNAEENTVFKSFIQLRNAHVYWQ